MSKKPQNPLNFTILKELFEEEPTKSQRTQIRIADAAIHLYANEGAQATIFEKVAKEAKVSRALVLRYFPTYSDLLQFMAKYIRALFQQLVVARISQAKDPKDQLSAYVNSTFDWLKTHPHHAKVWLYFFYICSIDEQSRELHTSLVDMGHSRIQKIVESGQKTGVFPKADARAAARAIQIQITGSLTSYLTEERKSQLPHLAKATLQACMACLSINDR
jgi:AcrR family transcriptional regulator